MSLNITIIPEATRRNYKIELSDNEFREMLKAIRSIEATRRNYKTDSLASKLKPSIDLADEATRRNYKFFPLCCHIPAGGKKQLEETTRLPQVR